MSPLVLLGSLGTAVSTISMLPHLVHAIRNRGPAGSAFAWLFGAFSSGIWFAYGFAAGDLLIAAPGFVTVPVGLLLSGWCALDRRRPDLQLIPEQSAPAEDSSLVFVPVEWERTLSGHQSGDTLELPRIA